MTNNAFQIKVKERLNKLSSHDYSSIQCWQIAEAANKAQLEFVRRQIHGNNQRKEGDESTKVLIDDLQILLVEDSPLMVKHERYYETKNELPSNYLYYKRISCNIKTECCPAVESTVYLKNVADVDDLLWDKFQQPSSEWAETFCTLQNNKARIYTDSVFTLENVKHIYYRKPQEIQFNGCIDINTGNTFSADQECEFKDDIAEMIVDETVSILSGDVENVLQVQRNKTNSTANN